MFKKTILTTLILLFSITTTVHAVGVSVTPSRLRVEAQANHLTTQEIKITNPSGLVSIYDIYPDDFPSWIKATPSSLTLEAGESREVLLEIKPPSSGSFSTQLSVVAKPLSEREFQANSGLKIPLEIRVSEILNSKSLLVKFISFTNLLYILNAVLIILLLVVIKKRTKKA